MSLPVMKSGRVVPFARQSVIGSEARQSMSAKEKLDCFVALLLATMLFKPQLIMLYDSDYRPKYTSITRSLDDT